MCVQIDIRNQDGTTDRIECWDDVYGLWGYDVPISELYPKDYKPDHAECLCPLDYMKLLGEENMQISWKLDWQDWKGNTQ